MKKLFTILCAVILTFSISAQTEQGIFLLSGSTGLNFNSQSVTDTDPGDAWDDDDELTVNTMEFEVLGAYFMADGIALGFATSYESETTIQIDEEDIGGDDYTYEQTSKESTTIIGPVLRFYVGESGLWGQVGYGFGTQNTESEYEYDYPGGSDSDSETQENKVNVLDFKLGYAIYLSDYISMSPTVGYGMMTVTLEDGYYDAEEDEEEDLKIKTSGMSFGLGVTLHLE